ncbi:hypothetical protein OZY43_07445 [Lactobacillus sp. ESL0785]|uniref:hypothetical protein n=1 Tax=Lactobacillus sp. ESL0785 TaxID=2983232 RepID=UPI0023F800DE|nr:hypothetical protein [Lactobacillus sp. ESL0785]WEV70761.1 hypothetical protein OZY43_07445 [Lactobacillus sp. ESL0785]
MKKATIWTIVAIALVALGGGVIYTTQKSSNNQANAAYTEAMNNGQDAAIDKDYVRASHDFNQALEIKKTAQAEADKKQADNMQAAISATKDGKYSTALNVATSVITEKNGYSVLAKQGRKLKTTIANVKDNYDHELKPLFAQAQKVKNNGRYPDAIAQYQRILDLPYINGTYYTKYKTKAKKGIKTCQKLAKTTDAATAAQATKASAAQKAKDENTHNAGKVGEGVMGDHTVHGKTVTAEQIAELRKKVSSLGFDSSSWSPQDLIDLYRKSGRNNPTDITKKDIQNYLKPQ